MRNLLRFTYTIHNNLYIPITSYSSFRTLVELRGPSFELPPDVQQSLQNVRAQEPLTVEQLLREIPENPGDLVIAGEGDPTERLDILLELFTRLEATRHPSSLRIHTNGLLLDHDKDPFLSAVAAVDIPISLSVLILAASEKEYHEVMGTPRLGDVLSFVDAAVDQNIPVELTAIRHPIVNVEATDELASDRYGIPVRWRSYHA